MTTPYLQTLGNGLRVLDALKGGPKEPPELVAETGIQRVAVYRILRTLETEGMVVRVDEGRAYQLSPKVWELGQAAEVGARSNPETARQVEKLRLKWGDTVHVSIYDVGEVIYVYKVDGTTPLRAYTTLGGRAPATAVASGKVLLAFQAEGEIERVTSKPLERFTERSVTARTTLLDELERARATLNAVNHGEWREGIGGVASPILTPTGAAVAAVSISGFADRITGSELPERASEVKEAARSIAVALAPEGLREPVEQLYEEAEAW